MKRLSVSIVLFLVANLIVSCTGPAISPAPSSSVIQPGDTLGEAVLNIAKDETGEPDIFTYCNPIIAESDPRVIVRTCNVPQLPYLFLGYAELANTQEELESIWQAETWQFYFDEHAVDLEAFGFFDMDWEEYRMRRWKIAVENLTPGEHSLHYIVSSARQQLLLDVIWVFTVGESAAAASPALEEILYPALSSQSLTGQHAYASEKAGLNFWWHYGKAPAGGPFRAQEHTPGIRGVSWQVLYSGG